MLELFKIIREESSAAIWSKGVNLAREGAVVGEDETAEEIRFKVSIRGRTIGFRVSLFIEDEDWSCDCEGKNDPCEHVAAAIIALKRAKESGKALPKPRVSSKQVGYRLKRSNDNYLELHRVLTGSEKEEVLKQSLVALSSSDVSGLSVAITKEDIGLERELGQKKSGGLISTVSMSRVIQALSRVDDIQYEGEKISIGETIEAFTLIVDDHSDGFLLKLRSNLEDGVFFENHACLKEKCLSYVSFPKKSEDDEEKNLIEGCVIPQSRVHCLMTKLLPRLKDRYSIEIRTKKLPKEEKLNARIELSLNQEGDALKVLPLLVYGKPAVARIDHDELVIYEKSHSIPVRDKLEEDRLKARLNRLYQLQIGVPKRFRGEEAISWAQKASAQDVFDIENRAVFSNFHIAGDLEARFDVSDDHFALNFSDQKNQATLSAERALASWAKGESLVSMGRAGFFRLPLNWLERYGQQIADVLAARSEKEDELKSIVKPQLIQLLQELDYPLTPNLKQLAATFTNFDHLPDRKLPSDLKADLRSYQRVGVNWLAFLKDISLGALLADDMGLGKTLEAISVFENDVLVVAPTSVLRNWENEIKRFRPNLKVGVYHGKNRELSNDKDVWITTYAILRLDLEKLKHKKWKIVVLDEAQQIKNPQSQAAQAAYELDADWRVAMTGTPIENRLEELWSLFHFTNRGLLGGLSSFNQRYVDPISIGNRVAIEDLHKKIKPFILRRKKSEVAKELPPRTESLLHIELNQDERDLYNSLQLAAKHEVVQKLEEGGSVMAALEALLRLRQAACHRALIPGKEGLKEECSSKLNALVEKLSESIENGHKSLVFSQWTSLLDCVEIQFEKEGFRYLRLDGTTKDRQVVVDQFQDPDGPPLMLISLKAGGVGLTLTQADHVYLLDPWWNPAVEDQAADRAHRIGQDKPVMVYRMVAENTVEERMIALQEKKRALAEAALAGSIGQSAKLTKDDLLQLLSD